MAITISAADVKRKAMIATSDYDSAISALIAEMQPALEHSISPEHLANTADTNLQAVLKLGMLEIITGEFLEQLAREPGATEAFSVAGLSIGETARRGVDLIQQGATRLAPFLRGMLPMMCECGTSSSTKDANTVFSVDEEVW